MIYHDHICPQKYNDCEDVAMNVDCQSRAPTTSGNQGNQGKLEGIFPVREKSGNLAFSSKIREKSGNFDDPIFFLYFDETIYFHH